MSTQLISPTRLRRFDIRCNVGDVALVNVAIHFVFFFDRRLDSRALADSFARALGKLPIFAGRIVPTGGALRIRCGATSEVPFACVSSDRTRDEAIRSISEDRGGWLIDPVNGPVARWGFGPLCRIRVTHLADGATAIGVSFHHAIGDIQTAMYLMNAWTAAAAGTALPEPLIVEDRAAYLDEHLPPEGGSEPGVRCLGLAETARSLLCVARDGPRLRTWSLYFGEDEILRMRNVFGSDTVRLSANDVVCAQVSEALMTANPHIDRRSFALAVNMRTRCGLDPMLVGNLVTALNIDLRRGQSAESIAERIRHKLDRFVAEHSDMRINQQFLDEAGSFRGMRCVAKGFDPVRWNPVFSNWSGIGAYRISFEGAYASYFTPVMRVPYAGFGILSDAADGRGVVFQMTLPPNDFAVMSSAAVLERLHRFR